MTTSASQEQVWIFNNYVEQVHLLCDMGVHNKGCF